MGTKRKYVLLVEEIEWYSNLTAAISCSVDRKKEKKYIIKYYNFVVFTFQMQKVHIYLSTAKSRVYIAFSVRMNIYNSETSNARTTKFGYNIAFYYSKIKYVLEFEHAHLRHRKAIKFATPRGLLFLAVQLSQMT